MLLIDGFYAPAMTMAGIFSAVLCLSQDFCGTLVSPYLDFRGTIANSEGHTKSIIFLPVYLIRIQFPVTISGSFHFFLHNFVFDFDSFGSRMGVYVTEVVSAIAVVINSPASFLFLF